MRVWCVTKKEGKRMDTFQRKVEEQTDGLKIEALDRIADALDRIAVILYQIGGGKIRSCVSGDQAPSELRLEENSTGSHVESE